MVQNNILYVLYAILPAIIYSWALFKFVPEKMIGLHRARRYISAAFLSPILVLFIHYIFPTIWTKIEYPICGSYYNLLFTCLIEIALVEEVTKYMTYSWVTVHRKNSAHDYPIATLFYCMMSAAGFSIVENLYYLINVGESVLFIRSFTAIVLHLNCGIIMGYFIAKSKLYSFDKNIDVPYIKYNPIEKIRLVLTGVVGAILLHGLYNYNMALSASDNDISIVVYVILFGTITSVILSRKLIKESIKLKQGELVKELEL